VLSTPFGEEQASRPRNKGFAKKTVGRDLRSHVLWNFLDLLQEQTCTGRRNGTPGAARILNVHYKALGRYFKNSNAKGYTLTAEAVVPIEVAILEFLTSSDEEATTFGVLAPTGGPFKVTFKINNVVITPVVASGSAHSWKLIQSVQSSLVLQQQPQLQQPKPDLTATRVTPFYIQSDSGGTMSIHAVGGAMEGCGWTIKSERQGSAEIPLRRGFTCRKYFQQTSNGQLSGRLFEWYIVKDTNPMHSCRPSEICTT
jgi:hypothetical protein